MTGEHLSDRSDSAAPSGSTWRGATGTTRMLAATRLTRAAMPGLVEGSEPAGMLRTEVAEAWGVRRVPSRGRGRRPGRLSGAGVIDGSRASLSLGTSGVLFVADAAYRTNPERAVHSFPAARRPAGRGHRAGAVRELRAAAPVGEWFRTASVVRQSHRRAVGRDQDLAVASLAPDVVPVRIGSDRNVLRSRRPPERAGGQDVGLLALNMNDSPARIDPEEAAIGRLTQTGRRLVEASVSPNTRRAYAGALRRLDAWLDGRPLHDGSEPE